MLPRITCRVRWRLPHGAALLTNLLIHGWPLTSVRRIVYDTRGASNARLLRGFHVIQLGADSAIVRLTGS